MTRLVVPPLMTRLRCSVESSSDTANILRGCEMAWGLTMAKERQSGSSMPRGMIFQITPFMRGIENVRFTEKKR